MKIIDYFYNVDYFKVNSDNLKIESGATMKTVQIGLYKIKLRFPVILISISDFNFTSILNAGNDLTFQVMNGDNAYYYSGGWVAAAEDNIAQSNDLATIKTNISSFITGLSNFNIIIYVNTTGTDNFLLSEMSFIVDSGINEIYDIRQNLLEITYKVYPDYMVNNALKFTEELIEEQLSDIIDFTATIPATVRLAAQYLAYIDILESIYYEQIRRGENINDIEYWKREYDKLISGIKSGSLIPGTGNVSLNNETSIEGQYFGMGIYGRPRRQCR